MYTSSCHASEAGCVPREKRERDGRVENLRYVMVAPAKLGPSEQRLLLLGDGTLLVAVLSQRFHSVKDAENDEY